MQRIFFSIDDKSIRGQYEFTKSMDQARAMGKLVGSVHPCVGTWQSIPETSYVMLLQDFVHLSVDPRFCKDQGAVILTGPDTGQPVQVMYMKDGVVQNCITTFHMGKYLNLPNGDWTFDMTEGVFYADEEKNRGLV